MFQNYCHQNGKPFIALLLFATLFGAGCAKSKDQPSLDWPKTPSESTFEGDGKLLISTQNMMCDDKISGKVVIFSFNSMNLNNIEKDQKEKFYEGYLAGKARENKSVKDIKIQGKYNGIEVTHGDNRKYYRLRIFWIDNTIYEIGVSSKDKDVLQSEQVEKFLNSFRK